jgi:hypothetical protein
MELCRALCRLRQLILYQVVALLYMLYSLHYLVVLLLQQPPPISGWNHGCCCRLLAPALLADRCLFVGDSRWWQLVTVCRQWLQGLCRLTAVQVGVRLVFAACGAAVSL